MQQYLGAGPINQQLNTFYDILLSTGRSVKFGRNKNVTAIKTLYQRLQEYHQIPELITQHAKNNQTSKKLRLEGNKMFESQSDLSNALEMYNQSICWADQNKGEELAIGFANRSAVYFEWKKYDLCMENIELAVKAGCPERLIAKLNQRKADCIKLTKEESAKKDDETPPDSKIMHLDQLTIKMSERRRFYSKNYCFNVDKNRCAPSLSLESNPSVPFIVNCLEMRTSAKKGRYIVTTEDLKPGQIIAIEEPFLIALTKDHRYRKCANCFAENSLNLLPCKSCTCTMFCSQECLIESEKGFHQYECPIAEYIWTQCEEFAITLRLVVKAFTMFDSVQELIAFRDKNKKANVTAFSFNHKNDLSDKERYSQIDNLLTNEDKRTDWDMFSRGCKVALLYHYLIEETKFGEMLKTQVERDTLISIILQHSQITSVNCFNCNQYDDVDLDAFTEFKSINVFARGVYPFSSLFNHSCAPNTSTITVGTKIVTYVTRVIKKNWEVLGCLKRINHFQRYKDERQKLLGLMFSFDCECEACQNDFPATEDENFSWGNVSEEINEAADAMGFNLNEEVAGIEKFCTVLQKYSKYYPCGTLYTIGLKLQRALTLKYGNLSTQMEILLRNNNHKFRFAFKQ